MLNYQKISFFLRRSAIDATKAAIYIRLTVNKQRVTLGAITVISGMELPKSMLIDVAHWDAEREAILPASPHAKRLNEAIFICKRKLDKVYQQHEAYDIKMTARGAQNAVKGVSVRPSIQELIPQFLEERSKTGATPSTVKTYGFKFRPLVEFLKSERMEGTAAEDFTPGSLNRYRTFLITKRNNKPRSADKKCQTVKTLLIWAAANEVISKNPLLYTRVRVDKTPNLTCLTQEEVYKVSTAALSPLLRETADCYVFACYTGLAYGDIQALTPSQIQSVEGKRCLMGRRNKTSTEYCIPITGLAQSLIDKYGGINKLPLPELRKYNFRLREVMNVLDIDKPISSHTARKTFADWCINELGLSEEATIVAMGQKSTKELSPYRRTRPKRLLSEFPGELLQAAEEQPKLITTCKTRPITGTPFFRVA